MSFLFCGGGERVMKGALGKKEREGRRNRRDCGRGD